MGAVDFSTFVPGNLRVDDAYKKAVDDAYYYAGHDPYNGTISTTEGFVVVDNVDTRAEAQDIVERYWAWEGWYEGDDSPQPEYPFSVDYGRPDKWGVCFAIECRREPGWLFFGLAAC